MAAEEDLNTWFRGAFDTNNHILDDPIRIDSPGAQPWSGLQDFMLDGLDYPPTAIIDSNTDSMFSNPVKFVQQLTLQNQLLACLKWLSEFQVLACIPLDSEIPFREVAELANVPLNHLCRIIRTVATAGFLVETSPECVAHTVLSTAFVTDLWLFDAVVFLAKTAAPAALQMPAVTQRHGAAESTNESAYALAFNTSQPFRVACSEQTRLQRQWKAYQRLSGNRDEDRAKILTLYDWNSLDSVKVVDVCARSMEVATAIAAISPTSLQFIVQIVSLSSSERASNEVQPDLQAIDRIHVQRRIQGSEQTIKDAAVYLLYFSIPSSTLRDQVFAELTAHIRVLRDNSSASLILATPLLPQSGTVDIETESMARLWDLTCLQLSNESELEIRDLNELVSSVRDSMGVLAVVQHLRSSEGLTVAMVIKYKLNEDLSRLE